MERVMDLPSDDVFGNSPRTSFSGAKGRAKSSPGAFELEENETVARWSASGAVLVAVLVRNTRGLRDRPSALRPRRFQGAFRGARMAPSAGGPGPPLRAHGGRFGYPPARFG